jgi:hypothetical protein
MNHDSIPRTPSKLAKRLYRFRQERRERKKELQKLGDSERGRLSSYAREQILRKTGRRCHICGGKIRGTWQADHVLTHSVGGENKVDNYLPAHKLCNNYRWDYSAEEFQYILKIGVWARTQIERQSDIGVEVARGFLCHERTRVARRRNPSLHQANNKRFQRAAKGRR